VRCKISRKRRKHYSDSQANDRVRGDEAGQASREREENTLRQKLPDQATPGSTQRKPDADLPLPRDRPSEHHVCHIRTSQEQDETKDSHYRTEYRYHFQGERKRRSLGLKLNCNSPLCIRAVRRHLSRPGCESGLSLSRV
jgi:hypothetical protein